MVKMGFSAHNTSFGQSSVCPPHLWVCRSCTQFYLFSTSSRFICRREDKCSQNLKGLVSNRNRNAYVVELNQRVGYCTFQQREGRIQYRQGNDSYRPRFSNSYNYGVDTGDDQGVGKMQYQRRSIPQFRGSYNYRPHEDQNTYYPVRGRAEDWKKVTEDFRKDKLDAEGMTNTKIMAKMDIAEEVTRQKGEGRGVGLSVREKEYDRGSRRNQLPVLHGPNHLFRVELPSENAVNLISPSRPSIPEDEIPADSICDTEETKSLNKLYVSRDSITEHLHKVVTSPVGTELHQKLERVYDRVLVVDSASAARKVVGLLTNEFKNFIHACDTEVANINVKEETPVDHGNVICFSIYSGPDADYGDGKSCIWVDVLGGGGEDILKEFAPFFEDESIKKVWHNYSFDSHVIENYGIKVRGFCADTMHMARLWNSARRMEGGYSLEALSGDSRIMSDAKRGHGEDVDGKISMKTIFGRKKVKKDGSFGKLITIPPVEELQRDEKKLWVCYSVIDSISTLKLYESLEKKLRKMPWSVDGQYRGCMFNFYLDYLRPFGELLVKMEKEGMLVDRAYLAEIEKVAKAEQQVATDRFRRWASKYCPDAKYMNIGSDTQLRQLFFGGIQNSKDHNEFLPVEKEFKVPNVDGIIEEGKKVPSKFLKITLRKPDGVNIVTDKYTATGWPSVGGDVLKDLSGKVSADFDFLDENISEESSETVAEPSDSSISTMLPDTDTSAYGSAYAAFGSGQEGIEACHAIAALCEVCSIDSLISNFIIPLQGHHISGKNGRIHCSLNINTETGRLSARRPNLQNQPALEKDRYKIRQAFIAAPGNSLIVADYGQLELRILAHLANCKSMLDAFKAGGDFHSRTAMNMYPHIRDAVQQKNVLLEWHPQPGEDKPPVPLLKDAFASERRKAKMLNFSIAYGKTVVGLARDWKVSRKEAQETVNRWYSDRQEVLAWQQERKKEAQQSGLVYTLLGRARHFPSLKNATSAHKGHIERAAINTPVQGSAADVAMCAMLEISKNARLQELGWRLILQVHDEVILEGPTESAEEAKTIVVNCMSKPFNGENFLKVDLSVDAKCAQNWYSAK